MRPWNACVKSSGETLFASVWLAIADTTVSMLRTRWFSSSISMR
jgi:hypothetical protein